MKSCFDGNTLAKEVRVQFLARRAHHLAFWDGVTPTLVRIYSEARVASDTALFFFQLKCIACTLFFVQDCTLCALKFTDRLFLVNDGFTSACFFIFFLFWVADDVATTNTFNFIQFKTIFANYSTLSFL